jgi:hypothetical protein
VIKISELLAWAATLDPTGHVGIYEDGLTLVELPPRAATTTGAYLEIGGYDDPTSDHATVTTPEPLVLARQTEPVIAVSDLGMLVGPLTTAELRLIRTAIKGSTVYEALDEVVFAAFGARRKALTRTLCPFPAPTAFQGCLDVTALDAVPTETVVTVLTQIRNATGLALLLIRGGGARRLCVEDPETGRLFDIGDDFGSWLRGDTDNPGDTAEWIGPEVEDFTRIDLTPTAAGEYLLVHTHTSPH